MGRLYNRLCYVVEDVFIKLLTKNKDQVQIKEKVTAYRRNQEALASQRKADRKARSAEKMRKLQEKKAELERQMAERRAHEEKLRKEREERLHQEVLSVIQQVVQGSYTSYEYREVKQNLPFFRALTQRVFESNETGLTFLYCEFDKTKTKEYRGYLVVTSKRVLFLTKDLMFMDKFRYQTIINVAWFQDGLIEKGLYIQYGKKRLEFDEIFDRDQMHRVGNTIQQMASRGGA